jgi:uncharacterized protein (TIGR00369 family)
MTPEQLVRNVTQATGYTRAAGVEVVSAEPGRVVLSLASKPELLQFNGYFHGGTVSGLADHAAGAAATTALPPGRIAVTVDLHVNFLAPASGPSLVAKARALQVGSTICVVTVELETDSPRGPRLCAVANATLRVVDMPAPSSKG